MRTAIILSLTALASLPPVAAAQTKDCEPVADRAGRALGCFITARTEMGRLPRDSALYWYIDSLPGQASPAIAAHSRATIVQSLGSRWLFTIAPKGASTAGGQRVAVIGPLPLVAADSFAAVYMEGVFQPGMETRVHRHPGVEAWYTVEGAQCVETPKGKQVQRAGDPGVMALGGDPMRLTGIGTGIRRSLVLILQDATQPRNTHATDWTPKDLCHVQ